MKQFESLDELWLDAANEIIENGTDLPSRDGNCREVMGYVARLTDPMSNFMFNPVRKMHPSYAAAELIWYLSGETEITRIEAYAPQYKRFVSGEKDDGLHSHGAYGGRLSETSPAGYTMLAHVVRCLVKNPESRQICLALWNNARDLPFAESGGVGDIPCTLALNFLVRDGRLNLCATMRSNDIWLGTPYDIWCFTSLQFFIAEAAKLKLGWYQHQAMSLHAYERNHEKVQLAADPPEFTVAKMGGYLPDSNDHSISEPINELCKMEKWNRQKGTCTKMHHLREGSRTHELMLMASVKWAGERAAKQLWNPTLKKYCLKGFCS